MPRTDPDPDVAVDRGDVEVVGPTGDRGSAGDRDGDSIRGSDHEFSDNADRARRRVPVRTDGGSERERPDEWLSAETGEQVLLVTGAMSGPLGHLPDEAFSNLLLITVRDPNRIERAVERRGIDPRSVGVVPISGSPVAYDGPMWCTDAVSPNDLTGISMAFAEGMRYVADGEGWVVLDNVSTLLMYAADDRLHRLVSHLVRQCREQEVRAVYAIAGESVTEQTLASFSGLCDRVEDRSE
ncbi:hypothetical protein Hbl1158_07080 [Halobaculum sp. CBA1158]|uniref:DUF7504 family protein n=1 Tax=Halobaculum sp. CBA1158 TaxID=2904243 RepID=UPI001F404A8B|nr:hypothetical protein [Halobaculum sp. CBA1158]UIP01102.1 hypothetical protein Hbl1158_07080 [Halobaculum sp. CBA1158]